jgi:amidase
MLVGIKPTVGRISRYGIIPISADQDTAGPMARTVTDAAILLGVLEGPQPDPHDPVTSTCPRPPGGDYTRYLDGDGLRGARIGIPRAFYYEPVMPPGAKTPEGGLEPGQAAAMAEAIAVLERAGAVVVDPADLPSVVDPDPQRNLLRWDACSGGDGKGRDASCSIVLKYGMKHDFNAWLGSLGSSAPFATLADLIAFNRSHPQRTAIKYGQSRLEVSEEMDIDRDRQRYEADRARDLELAAIRGIAAAIARDKLDALLFPRSSGASVAARPGYPSVIVPFAFVPNDPTPPFPPGFDAKPAPFGVAFTATACSEPRLLALAYSFEQATRRRVPPLSAP